MRGYGTKPASRMAQVEGYVLFGDHDGTCAAMF